jgi:hypothetical protein
MAMQQYVPGYQYVQPQASTRASARTRWLWVVPLLAGLLLAAGWLLAHDPAPGLALTPRGLMTAVIGLGVAAQIALARRSGGRELARTLVTGAAWVALTVLLMTASAAPHVQPGGGAKPAPKPKTAQALDLAAGCPAIGQQPLEWVKCAWAASHSPTTTSKGGDR